MGTKGVPLLNAELMGIKRVFGYLVKSAIRV